MDIKELRKVIRACIKYMDSNVDVSKYFVLIHQSLYDRLRVKYESGLKIHGSNMIIKDHLYIVPRKEKSKYCRNIKKQKASQLL